MFVGGDPVLTQSHPHTDCRKCLRDGVQCMNSALLSTVTSFRELYAVTEVCVLWRPAIITTQVASEV
jgi:hypothetical protein